jgi:hypothetical protein
LVLLHLYCSMRQRLQGNWCQSAKSVFFGWLSR